MPIVKILEEKIIHEGHEYMQGETRHVTDGVAAYFCEKGWAEDTAGTIPTGDREKANVSVSPDAITNQEA